ncbi:MAG: GntR family transcriptional regulator [Gammaproteobacteria bacterium]|nr:GntR family transcriptional regulator [Gammaproteobacteria bacterium]
MKASVSKLLPQDVYRQLKEMILSFALYPGSRITENELSKRFGVSRTPVREALQRLAAEGYLTIRPKQGCFIREIDIDEINDYYEVRIALEMEALALAGVNMPDSQLDALAALWDPQQVPKSPMPVESMAARDEQFHSSLALGAGNSVLARYLEDVNEHLHIVRRLDFTKPERIEQTYAEHHKILELLRQRDVKSAQALMLGHIRKSANVAKTITLTELAQQRIRSQAEFPAG